MGDNSGRIGVACNPCKIKRLLPSRINHGILETPIAKNSLKKIAERTFGNMVEAVVDIDKELAAVDAIMHADLEALLLKNGSMHENL